VLHDRIHLQSVDMCDVVVFQRPSHPDAADAIVRARGNGKRVIVDIDDDMWSIHPSNPAYEHWNRTSRQEVLEFCLSAADLVTVSTPDLLSVVRPMNGRVTVLPNMLPAESWPTARGDRGLDHRIVVGWAGSRHHEVDLAILSGILETLLDAYPQIEVAIAGTKDLPFRPHARLRLIPGVMIEQYPSILEQFDIGMIPLVDGRFNRCKSDLKFLEYAMVGIPSVASKVGPYESSVVHGVNGFLARNPKDWLKHLRRLIEDAELRRSIGAAAREFAETRTIQGNIGLWERAYELID
jgi:glycosyltransferase involved in cell wall biosynthesis